jgi:hypothetical protein
MPTTAPSSPLHASISKKMTRNAWLLIGLCVPVICVAVYYAPFLVSLGWHVMHGTAVNYRGLRVRVPLGWTADLTLTKDDYPANPQGITLEKQPKTLAFEVAGPEMMYFNLLLPDAGKDPAQQAQEWKNFFLQAHSASEFHIADLEGLSSGMDCLEATPVGNTSAAALTCISMKDGWVATYAGAQVHVPLFLDVAANLKGKR